jgi:hypothetical protein
VLKSFSKIGFGWQFLAGGREWSWTLRDCQVNEKYGEIEQNVVMLTGVLKWKSADMKGYIEEWR